MLDKLLMRHSLDAEDQAALLALPHTLRHLRPQELVVREDDVPKTACLLLSGFAIRHKFAGNGARQVFSIHLKGDIVDLHNSLLGFADHNVQTLTRVDAAFIPAPAIMDLAFSRPAIGKALWHDTLVDSSIFREWTLNVGRRDARSRTAHMLCEFALRLEAAGLGEQNEYELPMTQDQLADALGLTNVHVNRTLKGLRDEGLIEHNKRSVRIVDFATLAQVGDFDARYLHLVNARQLSKEIERATG
ncbi:MAG: Crp/Fnr family transcriptional regulator [Proteobacteria bacterium]|nr:Crp/Fnr family transcriptional regulator [Pseudomonadota bacterium]